MTKPVSQRIESIDILRGLVMIIMALDHAAKYFGHGFFYADPTDLETTTPLLFFTRWITHFCAPVFVFLAGTGAFLSGIRRKKTGEISRFLWTRGLWLVFVEMVIVNFGWTFDLSLSFHILQVIWAIGISMIVMSVLVYLPGSIILALGLVVVFGHNLLDPIQFDGTSGASIVWYILHQEKLLVLGPELGVVFKYPVLPWIGLMALGYSLGSLYRKETAQPARKRTLLRLGIGACVLFVFLRLTNLYGDPSPWGPQDSWVFSVISFFNTTKYPPSLLFLLMTIGPSLIFLSLTENINNWFTRAAITFGRVPFLFYILHIYLLHALSTFALVYAGFEWSDTILTAAMFYSGLLSTFGFGLPVVYSVWIVVVAVLYPVCGRYSSYRAANRDKRWLSYL
jgi:uncharacterized membrane protein